MRGARPTVEQERWLVATARLRRSLAAEPAVRAELAARTGGWRTTGPLARLALFALGVVAALLTTGLAFVTFDAGPGATAPWLIAGLAVLVAGEYLIRAVGLHASGVEEALVVAGATLVAGWSLEVLDLRDASSYVLPAAVVIAGLRVLNPPLVALGTLGVVVAVGTSDAARLLDATLGTRTTGSLLAIVVAAAALALGQRTWARPSHDRMLDWLVVVLPLGAYAWLGGWSGLDDRHVLRHALNDGWALVVACVLLGAAALYAGLRRRTHAPLLGFLGCVAVLAVELRYVGNLPLWLRPTLWGALAVLAAITVDRWLRTPRDGLTSERLGPDTGTLDLLQIAGASVLAQRSTPAEPAARDDFTPGGGRHGGGGASGSF